MTHPKSCPNCHGTDRWWSTVDQDYFNCVWPQLTHMRELGDNDETVYHGGQAVARCYKPDNETVWHIAWADKTEPTKGVVDLDSCLKVIGMDIVNRRTSMP